MKKIIVFDLDGTLAESKSPLDTEMSGLICKLLEKRVVSIISGGAFPQFQKQVISRLPCQAGHLKNLIIFPTKGGAMYKYTDNNWNLIYSNFFTQEEKNRIINVIETVSNEVNFLPEKHYGARLEDREAEFTFSALGQEAPPAEKLSWDPDISKRKTLKEKISNLLPEFDVAIGGSTSIDITQRNINKAYAIEQIEARLNFTKDDILYVGDALFPGGNDASVIETGIETFPVKNVDQTKELIKKIINE